MNVVRVAEDTNFEESTTVYEIRGLVVELFVDGEETRLSSFPIPQVWVVGRDCGWEDVRVYFSAEFQWQGQEVATVRFLRHVQGNVFASFRLRSGVRIL